MNMDLSIVVPAYKQAPTIQKDLRALTTFLQGLYISYEIILVIDGDIDETARIVQKDTTLSHIHIITLSKNHGKGYALKTGLAQACGDLIGFIDSGGDIEYSCLNLMINFIHFSHADIVVGSKRHPLSQVKYPIVRHVYSFGYQMLNRVLFRLNVRDTQVGAKLFRKEAIKTILPHIKINKFAFDLELLVQARAFGYVNIIESPVRITHRFQSTISTFVVFETLRDTITLFFRTRQQTPKIAPSPGIAVSFSTSQAPQRKKEHIQQKVQ